MAKEKTKEPIIVFEGEDLTDRFPGFSPEALEIIAQAIEPLQTSIEAHNSFAVDRFLDDETRQFLILPHRRLKDQTPMARLRASMEKVKGQKKTCNN